MRTLAELATLVENSHSTDERKPTGLELTREEIKENGNKGPLWEIAEVLNCNSRTVLTNTDSALGLAGNQFNIKLEYISQVEPSGSWYCGLFTPVLDDVGLARKIGYGYGESAPKVIVAALLRSMEE